MMQILCSSFVLLLLCVVVFVVVVVVCRYWRHKRDIAPGSETPQLQAIMTALREVACAASVCGAGAGGFLVAVLRPGYNLQHVVGVLFDSGFPVGGDNSSTSCEKLSVHSLQVNTIGTCVRGMTPQQFEAAFTPSPLL
jgi:hypothetical protein